MNLDPAPRPSKLVYLSIDAGLLVTALIIVYFAKDPYAPLPFVSAVLCVVLAAIIGLVPFLIEYAADSAEYVQAERGRVAEQVQRLHAAGESLARAAAQIKAVEEAVHKTAHAAENLPYRMQEKLAEFNEALAAKDNDDREALERELEELRAANSTALKAAADKIAKATAEWTALEAASRKSLDAAHDTSTKLTDRLHAALGQLDARVADLNKAAAAVPVKAVSERREAPPLPPEPVAETPTPVVVVSSPEAPAARPEPVEGARPEPIEGVIESVTFSETTGKPASEETKPKKPRAPRKPKPEDTLAALSADPAPTESGPAAAADEEPASIAEEAPAKPESSASSDGATRLLVTAYIGIGNKLYLRGEGPGLSWDKGVPMQFVSIGKWGWASHDATGPVKCKLYKNDDTAALSGEVTLEPGQHVEVTALF
ncbi:hypothetical protein Verru16b_00922 [Lacunisphaera limnophila]|uniref:Uncharacterized protein n=1 Tax=Lacunisphaera limnophila TaxID=1838286 RepID=A0A1D8ASK0_9BACT|nr:hypothetical protein [Lacunisphaera limnophila]AOS43864.1 hypothetical protein Verru16b_00922 [Lacunisphaera limnophila]